jgi:membrane protein
MTPMVPDSSFGASGQPAGGPGRPPHNRRPGTKAHDRPGLRRRVQRGIQAGKERYSGSSAEYLWSRLDALDFMNQALVLAGTLLLCAFPFLLVASALAGRSVQGLFALCLVSARASPRR